MRDVSPGLCPETQPWCPERRQDRASAEIPRETWQETGTSRRGMATELFTGGVGTEPLLGGWSSSQGAPPRDVARSLLGSDCRPAPAPNREPSGIGDARRARLARHHLDVLCFEKYQDVAHVPVPLSMSSLQSGSTLGRYELLVRIGRGGMASVWVARERSPQSGRQRLVAVKAMLPELARQSAFRSMFLEEGQLVRSINHENVVQVHDVGEVDGILYITMEWVEGESLRNIIRAAAGRRPIPAEIAVQVVSDAAAGLHAAHELRGWDNELRGIVHCDVSPHNVLIGTDGRAKVLDFGVASAMGHLDAQGIKGKPGYMAPEQARGGTIDRRADVYALGIVLYELTTGKQLVPTRDRDEALQLALNPRIVPPRAVRPEYPPELEEVVLTALQTDPDQRYQTAQEFQIALQRYLVEERVMVSAAGISRLLRKVVGHGVERRRELIASVLEEIDGELSPELVLQHPGLGNSSLWDYQPEASTGHHSSATLVSVSASQPVSSSEVGSASVHPMLDPLTGVEADLGSGIPEPGRRHVASTSPRVPSTLAVAAQVAVVACVAVALGFFLRDHVSPAGEMAQASTATANTDGSAPRVSAPPPPASPEPSASSSAGVSIESLPFEGPAEREASSADAGNTSPSPETVGDKRSGQVGSGASQASSGRGRAFKRESAVGVLQRISRSVARCGKPDGPTGSGTATVTFAPSGGVRAVRLPFTFSGTDVGACVEGRFRAARVPAFEGEAMTLSQAFQIK